MRSASGEKEPDWLALFDHDLLNGHDHTRSNQSPIELHIEFKGILSSSKRFYRWRGAWLAASLLTSHWTAGYVEDVRFIAAPCCFTGSCSFFFLAFLVDFIRAVYDFFRLFYEALLPVSHRRGLLMIGRHLSRRRCDHRCRVHWRGRTIISARHLHKYKSDSAGHWIRIGPRRRKSESLQCEPKTSPSRSVRQPGYFFTGCLVDFLLGFTYCSSFYRQWTGFQCIISS